MNSLLTRVDDNLIGLANDTVGLPTHRNIVSGYGSLMEREQALRFATEETRSNLFGRNAGIANGILVQQYRNIDLIICSLSRLCEVLPHSERFNFWPDEAFSASHQPSVRPDHTDDYELGSLVSRHESLAASIKLVIDQQHSEAEEAVLAEVCRSHEAMAWVLKALLKDEGTKKNQELLPELDEGILGSAIRWAFPSGKAVRETSSGDSATQPLTRLI